MLEGVVRIPKYFIYMVLLTVVFGSGPLIGSEQDSAVPLSIHRFRVIFDGRLEIRAVEVRGLRSETLQHDQKLKQVDLVIVRPMQLPDALWQWRANIIGGKKDKRSGIIEILGHDGTPVMSFIVREAWPIAWEWPALKAGDPAPAMETIYFRVAEVDPVTSGLKRQIKTPEVDVSEKKSDDPFQEMDKELDRTPQRRKEN